MAASPLAVALSAAAIAMAAGIFYHFNFGLEEYMGPLKGGRAAVFTCYRACMFSSCGLCVSLCVALVQGLVCILPASLVPQPPSACATLGASRRPTRAAWQAPRVVASTPPPTTSPPHPRPDACGLNGPPKGPQPEFLRLGNAFLDGLHCLVTPFFLDCVATPVGRFWVRIPSLSCAPDRARARRPAPSDAGRA